MRWLVVGRRFGAGVPLCAGRRFWGLKRLKLNPGRSVVLAGLIWPETRSAVTPFHRLPGLIGSHFPATPKFVTNTTHPVVFQEPVRKLAGRPLMLVDWEVLGCPENANITQQ